MADVRSCGPENKNAICNSHMLTRSLPLLKNESDLIELNDLSDFNSSWQAGRGQEPWERSNYKLASCASHTGLESHGGSPEGLKEE